jgi:hypothetical protein
MGSRRERGGVEIQIGSIRRVNVVAKKSRIIGRCAAAFQPLRNRRFLAGGRALGGLFLGFIIISNRVHRGSGFLPLSLCPLVFRVSQGLQGLQGLIFSKKKTHFYVLDVAVHTERGQTKKNIYDFPFPTS